MTLIVTGARAPVAQDLARALRAAGHAVHLADSVTPWAAKLLRPRFPVHRLPPPRSDFAGFRAAMLRLIETAGATQVIPTCEEVFWLAEAAARDGWADRLFAPTPDMLRMLHSKAEFAALATRLGLDAPETHLCASPDELAAVPIPPEELVLKPEYSRFGTHVHIAPTQRDIAEIAPTPQRRWLAQRRMRGQELCTWAAAHAGRVTAFAAYRPRWRHGRAAAFQFEAVDAPAARHVTDTIASATGLTGHLAFDIILDEAGHAHPIECNPRAVSGLHLFDASLELGHAVAGDGAAACVTPPPGRLRHLAPAMALLGIPAAIGAGRLGALIADWRAGSDAIGRPGDRLATIGCLADAARFSLNAMLAGRTPSTGTTADIEWDGQPIG